MGVATDATAQSKLLPSGWVLHVQRTLIAFHLTSTRTCSTVTSQQTVSDVGVNKSWMTGIETNCGWHEYPHCGWHEHQHCGWYLNMNRQQVTNKEQEVIVGDLNMIYLVSSTPPSLLTCLFMLLFSLNTHSTWSLTGVYHRGMQHEWSYPPKSVKLILFKKSGFLQTCCEHSFSFQMIPRLCKCAYRFKSYW